MKVDEFYFFDDFIILDMGSTRNPDQIPIILGHPFLVMTNTCINCRTRVMDKSFENKKIKLNIFNASQGPSKWDGCIAIDLIEENVKKNSPLIHAKDRLQSCSPISISMSLTVIATRVK